MGDKKQWLTVEPPMFLYMMAFMTTTVIEQAFYVYQACTVNHGYSPEVCHNISQYDDINNRVQQTVSTFHQWNGVASHVVPFILAFFLGSYSDRRGRKIVLVCGLVGKLFFSAMLTVNSLKSWPVEYIIYTASFPSALTGADLAIFAACFAYIADVSTVENRTLRVGILDAVYLSTMPTGVAIGSVLWKRFRSYPIMFAINTSLMIAATLYTILFLKWQTRPEQKSLKEAGLKNALGDFFDLENINTTLNILVKKRPNNRRLFLWFILLSMAFYTFHRDERSVMYMYAIKEFKWDTTAYSHFRTYLSAMYVTAMLFGIPIMSRIFKWTDTLIVMLGAVAHICGHLVYAHAKIANLWYLGATLAALGPCVAPLLRSMASKVLPASERGVAYAFLSVMENAVGMFAAVAYSQLYKNTLDTQFSNATFYLTVGTLVAVFALMLTMSRMLKGKQLKDADSDDYGNSNDEMGHVLYNGGGSVQLLFNGKVAEYRDLPITNDLCNPEFRYLKNVKEFAY
ncbi:tetracyclin-resistance protein [Heliothis zea nudivirus]|uniref:Tetracyclin-resistance protein n=1 Tax=Heliothis zea nudivirus 1 TaxID=3116536 RepID=Q8JKI7_9VIRU|nr:tetracyclin-resistance protein [Heliothis zea nudivirus]AAN04419.1 tetracyclin-resistance protein [Heliothis zea nudivirus]WCZ68503.1 membrane transporter [Heliothis virescens nudivirus]